MDADQLEPGVTVLLHNKTMSVVGIMGDEADPMVSVMKVEKAPSESYADIGGLEKQIQEMKEAVELPLTHPELYEDIGIKPPKGVILYGEPGTGKTLLAKAVANQTSATFLRVVGSELIQKWVAGRSAGWWTCAAVGAVARGQITSPPPPPPSLCARVQVPRRGPQAGARAVPRRG